MPLRQLDGIPAATTPARCAHHCTVHSRLLREKLIDDIQVAGPELTHHLARLVARSILQALPSTLAVTAIVRRNGVNPPRREQGAEPVSGAALAVAHVKGG